MGTGDIAGWLETPAYDDKALDALLLVPTYSAASITAQSTHSAPGFINVQYFLSQRDFQKAAKRKIAVQINAEITEDGRVQVLPSGSAIDMVDVGSQVVSPTGTFTAILRNADTSANGKKRTVEVWKRGQLIMSIDVTDKHGDFYCEETFGHISWFYDESRFVYIAERKISDNPDEKFAFRQDWGEKLAGKCVPTIFIVDIKSEQVKDVTLDAENLVPGQPTISKDGSTIYFTGFATKPMIYGVIYCQNRRHAIYRCDIDGKNVARLSDEGKTARSPRIWPEHHVLLYLSTPTGGAHGCCNALVQHDLQSGKTDTLVPTIGTPDWRSGTAFPGLYLDQLILMPFAALRGKRYAVMHTAWRSRRVIIAVDLSTGEHQNLNADDVTGGSWTVLDVRGEFVVAVTSTPVTLPMLMLGRLSASDEKLSVKWSVLDQASNPEASALLESLSWKTLDFSEGEHVLEVIFVTRGRTTKQEETAAGGDKPPVIVVPHGGPHSSYATDFTVTSFSPAGLAYLGFAVALVNFTGSTGFGQDAITRLLGRIGQLDVEEVHDACRRLGEMELVDKKRACVTGGSHGGLISAILIGKYPDYYRACVMRNPVMNVATQAATSDIPDWCYVEAGRSYDMSAEPNDAHLLTPEGYERLFQCSPAKYAHQVKVPTLLLLGSSDLRVPPSQSLRWAESVRGRAKVRINIYPDTGHALDTVDAERHSLQQTAKWFLEHLNQ